MPGWHESTKVLQKQDKVLMVGIIEEQHPDRCNLFMQWKKMDWPILVDSLNRLEVSVVPITMFIDEYGIIRAIHPREEELKAFIDQTFQKPTVSPVLKPARLDLAELKKVPNNQSDIEALRVYGDAVVEWGDASQLGHAIQAYQKAIDKDTRHGDTHFRLGVAYRKRYDSQYRKETDFANAIKHWKKALDINPNQYIRRRRIQQYGPRLDKPYPFYDWVTVARSEIRSRGETPVELIVEPGGAEFASPISNFEITGGSREQPDPKGQVIRDNGQFINIEKTVVPSTKAIGTAVRVHLVFLPNQKNKAYWNNEADGLVLWLDPPEGWTVNSRYHFKPNEPEPVSKAPRRIEFEMNGPKAAKSDSVILPGYALYYVCGDLDGICLYRRQDIAVDIGLKR